MRTGFVRAAPLPPTAPLSDAPLLCVPLSEPPRIEWLSVGQHGRFAREDYRLPELWCVHLYTWTGAFRAGDMTFPVSPGFVSVVAPDTPLSHFFRTQDPPAVHFSCGFRLTNTSENHVFLPQMRDSGAFFATLHPLFEQAIGAFGASPRRAEALFWDILWRLAEQGGANTTPAQTGAEPTVVTRTREVIELRLSEPLRVADLARAADLSHNHLTRLFHAATGESVVAYIRARRVERATRLLRHTTIPVKQIAAQVGLPDLHQFNKAIRAATGVSPRAVRLGLNADAVG